MKKNGISSKAAAPLATDNTSDLNEHDSGEQYAQTRFVDFGLRRLVHPADLECPPGGDGSSNPEDVVNAACDNLAVAGQDLKGAAALTKRGVADNDPVAASCGLCVLAALSANMERMLPIQFKGLEMMALMMLGEPARPDPAINGRASSNRENRAVKQGKLIDRSLAAIIRLGNRLEKFNGEFRGNFVDTKTAPTMKSLREFQLLRLTLPRELKAHVRTIIHSPDVRTLVPEAGPINGAPVPLFTGYPKGSAKR